jgi:hypothetical protein
MTEEPSDWVFSVEEISPGAYRASAIDSDGRQVDVTGTDPDSLLEECKRAAAEIADRTK